MKPRLIVIACLTLMAGLLSAQNIFGAFQIQTEPGNATITLYGTNQYLGSTPSQVIPVSMDQYMSYNWGVPGRNFDVVISKQGFIPIRQQIFVPFNYQHQRDALRNPTVFHFSLARQQVQPPPYWPYWNPTSWYHHHNSYHVKVPGHPGNGGYGSHYGPGGNNNQGGSGGGYNHGGHGNHAGQPRP